MFWLESYFKPLRLLFRRRNLLSLETSTGLEVLYFVQYTREVVCAVARPLGANKYSSRWNIKHAPCYETGICMCGIHYSGSRGLFSVSRSYRFVQQFPRLLCCCREERNLDSVPVLRMLDQVSSVDILRHERMILEERNLFRQALSESSRLHEEEDRLRRSIHVSGEPDTFDWRRPCALPGLVAHLRQVVTYQERLSVFSLFFSDEEQEMMLCKAFNL